ncbi:hypothetical protein LTR91_024515 [Friedmanniomyces endolithicus]|uniref:Uncharacterized protein n=1 Tax=Friedmanniomyces endolithicus TaxID=329885 RepID=A0AAN6H2K5_9PEZI|nr:hypothetical protein LTR57_007442 [Friedmanniomyces endolithicus]KAK0952243.1 hypothetical protein LTR91_024515 [Friedmanniomyces endolithicus]KAK0972453.1 hypothetical protein LTS01_014915 [Friedmanniomyces endolithicus]KAK1022389.1 hypothetical protein LTS16_025751 [Friedmanniomyces endolithicus]
MDKIKKMFSPGGDKDDEVMYGTPEPHNIHEDGTSGQGPRGGDPNYPQQDPSGALTRGDMPEAGYASQSQGISTGEGRGDGQPAQLQTDPNVEKKDHGVLRQILQHPTDATSRNPGGDKHDEMRYGTTAHSDQPLNMATTGTESIGGLGTSQIDSRPGAEDSSGISRQVLNPGGDRYDEQRYGETGSAVPGTMVSSLRQPTERSTSTMTVKSGMHGPYARQADTGMAGSEFGSTTGQALPDRSALGTSATGMNPTYDQPQSERSFPLSGGATNQAGGAGESHFGRDAGLAGAGAAGAGALAYETERSRQPQDSLSGYADPSSTGGITGGMDRMELGTSGLQPSVSNPRDVPGDPFGYHKPDETPVEGYVHHTHGPHSTDIANVLDPHVPGEFPTESGEDPHSSTLGRDAAIGGAGIGAAGLGAAGYEASQPRNEPYAGSASGSEYPIPTTTNMRSQEMAGQSELPSEPEHHYGRDAAVTGGVGAAGVAGYEALKDRDTAPMAGTTGQSGLASAPEHPSGDGAILRGGHEDSHITPAAYYEALKHENTGHMTDTAGQSGSVSQPEHHYGRDAAVAGGTGAAGVGGYEALKHHDNTAPATSTPMQSQPESHYGRDAGLAAGGAGAAGLGGYEALKHHDNTAPASSLPTQSELGNPQSDDAVLHGGHVPPAAYYEALRHENTGHMASTTGQGPIATGGPRETNIANVPDSRVQYQPEDAMVNSSAIPLMRDEPHYGRDAAIVGGTGLAAGGVYEATRPTEEVRPTRVELVQAIKTHEDDGHLHKSPYQQEKHESDLERAREQEAAHGGDHGQKKEGFLSRMLHGHKHEDAGGAPADDGIRTHTITGLPMNVGKYGDGHGGTDAAPQIPGAHATDPEAAADWEDIKSKNTAY